MISVQETNWIMHLTHRNFVEKMSAGIEEFRDCLRTCSLKRSGILYDDTGFLVGGGGRNLALHC